MGLKKVLAQYAERHDTRELAIRLGIEYPTLMRKLNPGDSQDLHACQLVKFIEATKKTWKDVERRERNDRDFALLDEIELRLGRVANHVNTPEYDFNFQGFSRLVKESSEATKAISDAFADGRVTPQEATDCIKELKDLICIAVQLIQSMEAIEKGGKDFRLLKDGKY